MSFLPFRDLWCFWFSPLASSAAGASGSAGAALASSAAGSGALLSSLAGAGSSAFFSSTLASSFFSSFGGSSFFSSFFSSAASFFSRFSIFFSSYFISFFSSYISFSILFISFFSFFFYFFYSYFFFGKGADLLLLLFYLYLFGVFLGTYSSSSPIVSILGVWVGFVVISSTSLGSGITDRLTGSELAMAPLEKNVSMLTMFLRKPHFWSVSDSIEFEWNSSRWIDYELHYSNAIATK